MTTEARPLTILLAAILGVTASLSAACRDKKNDSVADGNCSTAQALSANPFNGTGLPTKTIALTFDDGPGVRTKELSRYLKEKGIRAGFFINGKMLTSGPGILKDLVDDGHVIGNHTQTHADLTTLLPAQIIAELEQTDALIAPYVPDGRFMFRAPFGAFNDVALAALEGSAMKKYVGPIGWDMGARMGPEQAADWDCWSKDGESVPAVLDPKACGDLYLAEIRHTSNGIVLMHDPYFIDDNSYNGGTIDMVQYIVPILIAEGFTFLRVDELPGIAAALPALTTPLANTQGTAAGSQSGAGTSGDTTVPCPASPQITRPNP